MNVGPFEVRISEEIFENLCARLVRIRWPDEIEGAGWDYGVPLGYMKDLVEYWRTGFDWRAQEERINSFANFRAEVEGLGVHFVHERGKDPLRPDKGRHYETCISSFT